MKTRTSLSAESLIEKLSNFFEQVPDQRDPFRIEIVLKDFLMSTYAIFALKISSLLQFEEQMRDKRKFSHVTGIFGIKRVPSDTHMRSVVDIVEPNDIRPGFKLLFTEAQRNHALKQFEFFDNSYLLSVDATGFYHSDSVFCSSCLVKKHKATDEVSYTHQMLAGCIVHPNQKTVIPVYPEMITNKDGSNKNDCERNAIKRFLINFREDHPKLKVTLLTDALHSTLPNLKILEALNMGFILGVKPGSHEKLFGQMDQYNELGRMKTFIVEEEIGDKIKKKRIHEYRYWNGVLLNHQDTTKTVNFLDYTETTQWVSPKGKLKTEKVHYSWITDYSLYESSCMQIARAGRSRWKIENETFNTLKNQGYEFEHNFGHGEKNLATNFALIMMLAFLVDQLQQIGCKLFQANLEKYGRKLALWKRFQSLYFFIPFEVKGYHEFLKLILNPEDYVQAKNTS
ncbi:MAG: transposase [Pseudobdellovibrionaceae bacterium]